MRNLLTTAIASLALATAVVGTAAAADMSSSRNDQNLALKHQLQRDDSVRSPQRRNPLGQVISPGSQATMGQGAHGSNSSVAALPNGQAPTNSY